MTPKIAHTVVVTPGRCGLYETARELVAGLRKQGIDSRMVDPTLGGKKPNALYPHGKEEDRGAALADMEWAVGADLIVNHSGYDHSPIADTKQPVIHVAHGRPRSSFLSELAGSTPIYSYWRQKNRDPRFSAVVTFWPEHRAFLEVMFPGKPVHVVRAPCDPAGRWQFDGPKGYRFNDKKGLVNIVIADHFAADIDQFLPLHAAILFGREQPGVKVHLYARPKHRAFDPLLRALIDEGRLGELRDWVNGLEHVYRAATMVLTANEIDTRTAREASMCGCPVVRVTDLNDGWQIPLRAAMRMTAEDRYILSRQATAKFDPDVTARQFKAIIEQSRYSLLAA